jgi:hypothetical protein
MSNLDTDFSLYPLQEGKENILETRPGKAFIIKLVSEEDADEEGSRTVTFRVMPLTTAYLRKRRSAKRLLCTILHSLYLINQVQCVDTHQLENKSYLYVPKHDRHSSTVV